MTFQFLCPQGHLLEGDEAQMGQPCDCPMCGTRFIIPVVETGGGAPGSAPDGAPGSVADGAAPGVGDVAAGPTAGANPFEFAGTPDDQSARFLPPSAGGDPAGGPPADAPAGDVAPNFAGPESLGGGPAVVGNPFAPGAEQEGPRLLHIPCPNGHELETPDDMLGQQVLCPFCGAQFELRYKDSIENKRQKKQERDRRDRRVSERWFQWAIVIAAIVLIGLVVMIAVTRGSR